MNQETSMADFQGVAQGNWVKLTENGAGVVGIQVQEIQNRAHGH